MAEDISAAGDNKKRRQKTVGRAPCCGARAGCGAGIPPKLTNGRRRYVPNFCREQMQQAQLAKPYSITSLGQAEKVRRSVGTESSGHRRSAEQPSAL
jgi:hypothetical protein